MSNTFYWGLHTKIFLLILFYQIIYYSWCYNSLNSWLNLVRLKEPTEGISKTFSKAFMWVRSSMWNSPVLYVSFNIWCSLCLIILIYFTTLEKVCDQTPLNWNLTTVHYQGLDAYVNGSVAVGRVMTSYCQEGKRVRGNSVQTVHKCGAALSLTGSFSECEGENVIPVWISINTNIPCEMLRC